MAEKGIFIKILPSLETAAVSGALTKLTSIFQKAGADASRSFDAANKAMLATQSEYVRANNVMSAAADKLAKAEGDLAVATKRAREMNVINANNEAKAVEDMTSRELAAYTRLEAMQRRVSAARADDTAANVAAAGAAERNAAAMEANATRASNAGRIINGLGLTSAVAFGAIADGTIKAASGFEQLQTKIQAATGESAGNIKALGDGILDMAGKVGYSADKLSDASYIIAKSGIGNGDAAQ
jgi:hypothetical protein